MGSIEMEMKSDPLSTRLFWGRDVIGSSSVCLSSSRLAQIRSVWYGSCRISLNLSSDNSRLCCLEWALSMSSHGYDKRWIPTQHTTVTTRPVSHLKSSRAIWMWDLCSSLALSSRTELWGTFSGSYSSAWIITRKNGLHCIESMHLL